MLPLDNLKTIVATAEHDDLPAILGQLKELEAIILVRLHTAPAPELLQRGDRLLTFKEAAVKLSCSVEYLYHHQDLPFIVRTDYGPRVSEKRLQAYIANPQMPSFSGGRKGSK